MTGTIAWGCAAAALLILLGMMAGWPLGYRRGVRDAEEEAGWQRTEAEAVPEAPRPERGRHRHPSGSPRHEALPIAGYLPALAVPGAWNGTITVPMPAPAGPAPWDLLPQEPEAEPVLEPTAVLSPDPCSDSAWTRRMAADMDAWIAEHIGATDPVLKEITR